MATKRKKTSNKKMPSFMGFADDDGEMKLRFGKDGTLRTALGIGDKKMRSDISEFMKPGQMERNIRIFNSGVAGFRSLFKDVKHASPDELFFSIEELPLTGKEYWFLHFCTPGKEEQIILTFGRALERVKVNKTRLALAGKSSSQFEQKINCAAVCWMYRAGFGKKVALDSQTSLSLERNGMLNRLVAKNNKSRIEIDGAFPKFCIRFATKGKKYFEAVAYPSKKSLPFEIITMLKPPIVSGLGALMVNYYFDFSGILEGKKISGKAYLQKVIAVLPLAPWNWARIYFSSGAVLDFFAAKPLGGAKDPLRIGYAAYFEQNGKRTKVDGLMLDSMFDGDKKLWLLKGPNFYLSLQSYAMQTFVMKAKTSFEYDEYFVCAKEFEAKMGKKMVKLRDVGNGSGIVEDSSGYLI